MGVLKYYPEIRVYELKKTWEDIHCSGGVWNQPNCEQNRKVAAAEVSNLYYCNTDQW